RHPPRSVRLPTMQLSHWISFAPGAAPVAEIRLATTLWLPTTVITFRQLPASPGTKDCQKGNNSNKPWTATLIIAARSLTVNQGAFPLSSARAEVNGKEAV